MAKFSKYESIHKFAISYKNLGTWFLLGKDYTLLA